MPEISYLEAIRQALWQEMKRDNASSCLVKTSVVYGGAFGLTHGMLDEFGEERVRETPISEATIVATAIGAALLGMRPVAEIMFMDFILLSLDQIANQAAKMRFMFGGRTCVPMVVRMPGGSGSGAASQHSQSLESVLMRFPGLIVLNPSTPYDDGHAARLRPHRIYAALLEGRYRGAIFRSDLESTNPYNTYRYAGLPPGPIANAGLDALKAALNPARIAERI